MSWNLGKRRFQSHQLVRGKALAGARKVSYSRFYICRMRNGPHRGVTHPKSYSNFKADPGIEPKFHDFQISAITLHRPEVALSGSVLPSPSKLAQPPTVTKSGILGNDLNQCFWNFNVQTNHLGPCVKNVNSRSVDLGWSLRICISDKFPGDAAAALENRS